MRKIIVLFLFFIPFLYSCDKETEGISDTVYYVNIQLKGKPVMIVKQGAVFAEPGFVATENGDDVNSKVKAEGAVNTAVVGGYPINYSAKNKDGYVASASRLVLVVPDAIFSSVDLTGTYGGQRKGKPFTPEACNIDKIGDGIFFADDFFGGYYNVVTGYGSAYRLSTYFVLLDNNTIIPVFSNSPWGPGGWVIQSGTYDPVTGLLTYTLKRGTTSFTVTLTKK